MSGKEQEKASHKLVKKNGPKYLSVHELNFEVSFEVVPLSKDTYNETELKKIVEVVGIQKCFNIAVQFAIVGMVKGSYGELEFDGVVYDVDQLMGSVNCHIRENKAKLEPTELTPKRLARLFRFQIQQYIKVTGRKSFLYTKYQPEGEHPDFCFPGAEYMCDPSNSRTLLDAYKALDHVHQTTFAHRIRRIIVARESKSSLANPLFNVPFSVPKD
jgi:hypothetical protein